MTVVNLRLGGQGEDCAQVMSHQAPFVLSLSLSLSSQHSAVLAYSSSQSHSMTCMG